MLLMLDTNICIYGMRRDASDHILRRISGRSYGEITVSAITAAELAFGVENSHPGHRDANRQKLQEWLELFSVLDYPAAAMSDYAALRLQAASKGRGIGANDLLIAAHARQIGAVLVTNDAEFDELDGLQTVNWMS